MSDKEIYQFDRFRLEADERRLWRDQTVIDLPPKVFDTLLLLVRRAGALVSREEFFSTLWPTTVVTDASLGRHIWQVRKALDGDDEGLEYIQTVPKQGYRFLAEVRRVETCADNTAAADRSDTGESVLPQDASPAQESRAVFAPAIGDVATVDTAPARTVAADGWSPARATTRTRSFLLLSALTLLLVGGGGWLYWMRMAPGASTVPAQVAATEEPLQLALFDFSSDDSDRAPQDPWMSSALADLLRHELGLNERLHVVAGQRLAELAPLAAGKPPDAALLLRLQRQLGIRLALTGQYRIGPAPDALTLALSVFDTTTGEVIQRTQVSGMRTRPGELIATAGAQLRDQLRLPRLSTALEGTRQSTSTDDTGLLKVYAEGVQAQRHGDYNTARDRLTEATQRKPGFLPAQLALMRTLNEQGYNARAAEVARAALARASSAPRELRLAMEALMYESERAWPQAIETYRALFRFYPENIEYGLGLARTQSQGGNLNEALATLDSLRRHQGADDPRVDLTSAALAEARGDYTAERDAGERALRAARTLRAPYLIGRSLIDRGWGRNALGDHAGALSDYQSARAEFESIGDPVMQARVDVSIGGWYYERGEFARASDLYRQALTVFETAGLKASQASALQNLANIDWAQDRRVPAREKTETLLQLARELGDPDRESWTLSALAALQFDMGETDAAEASYRQALAIAERTGLETRRAWALRGLGDLLRQRGEYAAARPLLEQSLTIERSTRDYEGQAESLYRLGLLALNQGDRTGARKQLNAALDKQREGNQAYWGSVTELTLAQLDLDERRPQDALKRLDAVETALKDSEAESDLARARALRALALVATGKTDAARRLMDQALAFTRTHPDGQDAIDIRMAEVRLFVAERRADQAQALVQELKQQALKRELNGQLAQLDSLHSAVSSQPVAEVH